MKQKVYDYLNSLQIPYEVTDHAPVYTMEDMVNEGLDKLGTLCKNLFIRDAKGKKHFLVLADNDTRVDLKALGAALGAGKVSFASAERLEKYLGVTAGCVSPMGVLNDTDGLDLFCGSGAGGGKRRQRDHGGGAVKVF